MQTLTCRPTVLYGGVLKKENIMKLYLYLEHNENQTFDCAETQIIPEKGKALEKLRTRVETVYGDTWDNLKKDFPEDAFREDYVHDEQTGAYFIVKEQDADGLTDCTEDDEKSLMKKQIAVLEAQNRILSEHTTVFADLMEKLLDQLRWLR